MAANNGAAVLVIIGGLACVGLVAAAKPKATEGAKKPDPAPPAPVDQKTPDKPKPNPAPSTPTDPRTPNQPLNPDTVAQQLGIPPDSIINRITAALASTDPLVMRLEAGKLESEGWIVQGGDLRRAADVAAIGRAMGIAPNTIAGDLDLSKIKIRIPSRASSPPGGIYAVPDEPIAASPLPGVIKAEVSPASANPERIEAQQLTNFLDYTPPPPGTPNERVKHFQARHGLKASGHYGPATALLLAKKFGLCPPRPIAWPQKGRTKAKNNYRDQLLKMAAADPQRAEEFIRASKV